MTNMILADQEDGVAVLRMTKGATNPLDPALLDELSAELARLEEDPAVRALVLTGSNEKFFSIGFDLPLLLDLSREEFVGFIRAFHRLGGKLYTIPMPTIAAITGHAIAGGCILSLFTDYRMIAAGRKLMGVNEIKLGVPIPYLGERILQDLVGSRFARDIVETGDFFVPEESLRMGLADDVLPVEDVVPRAIARAAALGAKPRAAFAAAKRNRTEPVLERVEVLYEDKEREFLECWYSPETQALLREASRKF